MRICPHTPRHTIMQSTECVAARTPIQSPLWHLVIFPGTLWQCSCYTMNNQFCFQIKQKLIAVKICCQWQDFIMAMEPSFFSVTHALKEFQGWGNARGVNLQEFKLLRLCLGASFVRPILRRPEAWIASFRTTVTSMRHISLETIWCRCHSLIAVF